MVFHWSKLCQVSSVLRDSYVYSRRSSVVRMVSILPLIPNPSSILGTVQCALTTVGITVTFMFHSFVSFLARAKYLFIFTFLNFFFTQWSSGTAKSIGWLVFFLLVINTISSLLVAIKWSISSCKSHEILWVSFSQFVHIQFGSMVPTIPCLLLYSFCTS